MNDNKSIFKYLIIGQFFSNIGDFALEIVFILIALEVSNHNFFLVGIIYLFKFFPYILFGPIGGWISDNYNKRKIMIIADSGRFLIIIFLFMMYLFNSLNIYILLITGSLHTIGRTLFQPCFQSIIPEIIDANNLIKANSYSQISQELAMIIGPLLFTLIVFIYNKKIVVLTDAITYLISILFILISNYKGVSKVKNKSFKIKYILYDTKNNFYNLLKKNIQVINVIISSSISIFFAGTLIRIILPAFIIKLFNNDLFLGYIMTAIGIGTVTGGLICSRLINFKFQTKIILYAWLIYGLIFSLMAVTQGIIFLLIIAFILGISGAFIDIGIVTVIQKQSDVNDIGKNFALFSTFANTAEASSSLIIGALAFIDLKLFLILSCLFICITSITGILFLKRNA